jgi:uncharacterized membrane protein YjjB (DUF3815 family)
MIRLLVGGAIGAAAFAVVVGSPRRYVLGGLLAGALASFSLWLVVDALHGSGVFGAALGACLASLTAEVAARVQKVTAAAFLVPGLIPLVPGVQIYRAMLDLVLGHYGAGFQDAAVALLWAGAIAFGVVLGATPFRRYVP